MKFVGLEKSKESNELVTVPVTITPPVELLELLGVTFTVDVLTGGFKASLLFETLVPVTEYSHPVLISIEFMVSVTVDWVSVREVIEPCWKFGTTGTAITGLASENSAKVVTSFFIIIYHTQSTEISDTNWPVAEVPAPPAVSVITPADVIVPARLPATPPLWVITLP